MLQQADRPPRPRAHRVPEVDREQDPRRWHRRRLQHGEASSGMWQNLYVFAKTTYFFECCGTAGFFVFFL